VKYRKARRTPVTDQTMACPATLQYSRHSSTRVPDEFPSRDASTPRPVGSPAGPSPEVDQETAHVRTGEMRYTLWAEAERPGANDLDRGTPGGKASPHTDGKGEGEGTLTRHPGHELNETAEGEGTRAAEETERAGVGGRAASPADDGNGRRSEEASEDGEGADVPAEMQGALLSVTRGEGAPNATAAESQESDGVVHDADLVDRMLGEENVRRALKKLRGKGRKAPGVDGQSVENLGAMLVSPKWERIKSEIWEGRYAPMPVRPCEIDKHGGGSRTLGIPTVQDRLIQLMALNVLDPIFDPRFSENSFGFRKNIGAHMALLKLRDYVRAGDTWAVKMDLSKFFDRVDHDLVMAKMAEKITDRKMLKLLRSYLQAGVFRDGEVVRRTQGTPQGGPISPLMANVLLDGLDKELERREHRFVRYADDFVVVVRTQKAATRVAASVTKFLEDELKLVVNAEKSGVERPWDRKFLGYSMTESNRPLFRVSDEALRKFEDRVGELIGGSSGRQNARAVFRPDHLIRFICGWASYFRLAEETGLYRDVDGATKRELARVLGEGWEKDFTSENLKDTWRRFKKSETHTEREDRGQNPEKEKDNTHRTPDAGRGRNPVHRILESGKEEGHTGRTLRPGREKEHRAGKNPISGKSHRLAGRTDPGMPGEYGKREKARLTAELTTGERRGRGYADVAEASPIPTPESRRSTSCTTTKMVGGGTVTPPEPFVFAQKTLTREMEGKCVRSGVECFP